MSKLLKSGFFRLSRDRSYYIFSALMLAGGLVMAMICANLKKYDDYDMQFDSSTFFFFADVIGVVCAAFCSLFVGVEYSDGTARNKLVAGSGRGSMYLSNLIVCLAAVLVFCVCYMAGFCAVGIPALGLTGVNTAFLFARLFVCLVMSFAYTGIFVMLSMCVQNKTAVAIIGVISAFVLLFAAILIISRLNEPPMYDSYTYMDSTGKIVTDAAQPNPYYIDGTKRKICELVLDILPSGQALQMNALSDTDTVLMPLYSLIIAVISTICGMAVLRKKDIK